MQFRKRNNSKSTVSTTINQTINYFVISRKLVSLYIVNKAKLRWHLSSVQPIGMRAAYLSGLFTNFIFAFLRLHKYSNFNKLKSTFRPNKSFPRNNIYLDRFICPRIKYRIYSAKLCTIWSCHFWDFSSNQSDLTIKCGVFREVFNYICLKINVCGWRVRNTIQE